MKSSLRRLGLGLLVTILCGEVAVRSFDLGRTLQFETDTEVYWRFRPLQSGYVWGGGDRVRSPLIHLNADGIRDSDRLKGDADRLAILAVGDSYTFGWGVEESEGFVDVLEGRLGSPVRVVNAGVPAYGVFQMVAAARRLLPVVRPQIVLLTIVTGDVHRQPIADTARRDRVLWDYGVSAAADRGGRFLGLVYRGARRLYGRAVGESGMLPTLVEVANADDFRRWWLEDEQRLRVLARECRGEGSRLAILAWPSWREGDRKSVLSDYDRIVVEGVRRLADEEGVIPLLDLGERLYEHPIGELTIPIDDHPSPLAHRIAGSYLAEELGPYVAMRR